MNSLNSTKLILVGAAALTTALFASGCASSDVTSMDVNAAAREEPIYRTGSNIPVHEKALTKEEKAKQAEDSQRYLQQMQSTGSGNPKN